MYFDFSVVVSEATTTEATTTEATTTEQGETSRRLSISSPA